MSSLRDFFLHHIVNQFHQINPRVDTLEYGSRDIVASHRMETFAVGALSATMNLMVFSMARDFSDVCGFIITPPADRSLDIIPFSQFVYTNSPKRSCVVRR